MFYNTPRAFHILTVCVSVCVYECLCVAPGFPHRNRFISLAEDLCCVPVPLPPVPSPPSHCRIAGYAKSFAPARYIIRTYAWLGRRRRLRAHTHTHPNLIYLISSCRKGCARRLLRCDRESSCAVVNIHSTSHDEDVDACWRRNFRRVRGIGEIPPMGGAGAVCNKTRRGRVVFATTRSRDARRR